MDDPTDLVEQQLMILLRRVQVIHMSTAHGDVDLERSAYGILCRIADEGPQRLGSFATAFGLDPSTITRQVQALEKAGLAVRERDPRDGRASLLDLTPVGRRALEETRTHRRARLEQVVGAWPVEDRAAFGRLLQVFNDGIDRLGPLAGDASTAGGRG